MGTTSEPASAAAAQLKAWKPGMSAYCMFFPSGRCMDHCRLYSQQVARYNGLIWRPAKAHWPALGGIDLSEPVPAHRAEL